jgi:hypothetical protein
MGHPDRLPGDLGDGPTDQPAGEARGGGFNFQVADQRRGSMGLVPPTLNDSIFVKPYCFAVLKPCCQLDSFNPRIAELAALRLVSRIPGHLLAKSGT